MRLKELCVSTSKKGLTEKKPFDIQHLCQDKVSVTQITTVFEITSGGWVSTLTLLYGMKIKHLDPKYGTNMHHILRLPWEVYSS